ncbi:MAG TPA: hypothetical protein VMV39_02465 [Terracidiphilus sp.]|nr:hypothetical protein [Terracidiphilus sp.]
MHIAFEQIDYQRLNSRQKETYNFQKLSAVLADCGYLTIRLSDDWNGADFIAQHFETKAFLKVQLKSRLTFDKKYHDKDLYICFRDGDRGHWYMYNHQELLDKMLCEGQMGKTKTWELNKPYHFPVLSTHMKKLLEPYRIPSTAVTDQ